MNINNFNCIIQGCSCTFFLMRPRQRFFSTNGNGNLSLKYKIKSSEISLKRKYLIEAIKFIYLFILYDILDIHPDDFSTVPKLCHGLDRVLFNPGIHYLRDPRTNVYNYDPFLRNLCQPDEFNFDTIPKFIPPSQDTNLHKAAVKYSSKFVSSTSSIAPSMSHFYFLISRLKPMNLSNRFTGEFEDEPQTFTQMCRSPVGVHLRPHNLNESGVMIRSVVTEKSIKEDEKPTVLMQLGNVMEKLLTHSKTDFESMLKGTLKPFLSKAEETYNYLQTSNFLLRSQLDCHDPRLPKKSFDLKTRATLPIRMDVNNYRDYLSYKLHRPYGLYESFEREFFDLCRSALLKYNFQVRIGDMDGIMIAYHNTAEIFGFQYLTRAEMDEILYGNVATGDSVFKMVLKLYDHVLESIVSLYKNDEAIKLTFSLNKDASKLTIFSESEDETMTTASTPSEKSFNQFVLSVSNFINGFRSDDITLDPTGLDDWRLDSNLQQVKPNLAEYESARKKVTEVKSRIDDGSDSGRVSVPIMRNARRIYPIKNFEEGPEILAPWTIL
jgi:hypothetical protein